MYAVPTRPSVFNPLPAVVIGGPPHSGKSVLAYSLTRALRERGVSHYVLRAYPPDYEGDWFQEAEQDLVRHLRLKGTGDQAWVSLVRRDVARRHLPLIVDMGGLPTPEQEATLDECTHGILLTPDEPSRQEWAARFARHGLVLLADLRSDRHGEDRVAQVSPLLCGTIAGLERGRRASGPVIAALVAQLETLFVAAFRDTVRRHLESAPAELVVDLERLAHQLGYEPNTWEPHHLPAVLDYLPEAVPLCLYGRGPNWLYAAVALLAWPEPFYQFDARLGWITPPTLHLGVPAADAPLQATLHTRAGHVHLAFALARAHLDYTEAEGLIVPPVSAGQGVVVSGKLPLWLYTALAVTYAPIAHWVGVYQPQLGDRAVVVRSQNTELLPGTLIVSPPD